MAGILADPRELSGKHRDEFSHHSLANLSESGGIDCERHQRYIPTSEKKTAEHGKTSEKSPRSQRTRKIPVRPKSLRHTRRKVGDAPGASALARLVDALAAEAHSVSICLHDGSHSPRGSRQADRVLIRVEKFLQFSQERFAFLEKIAV